MFLNFYNTYISKYTEFIPPVFIFSLLFISDIDEIEKHAIKFSLQIGITIMLSVVFYLIILNNNKLKFLALIICVIIWIIFNYFKFYYLPLISQKIL